MMSYIETRELTKRGLINATNMIVNNYMKIYDEYYETGSRDSAFLKDLVDSLIGISAVLDVYTSHKGISTDYALEKLRNSRSYINSCIEYFESKVNKNEQ